jgi:type IV pilus assembly protein PilW
MPLHKQPRAHLGFTLIETLVAMTLGLIMLAGTLSVLFSSRITFMENERVAHLQESVRSGMEIILRDLRGGGYPGCAHALAPDDFATTLANPTHLLRNFAQPLTGFEATGKDSWSPEIGSGLKDVRPQPLSGSDILAIRSVRSNARFYRTATDMSSGTDAVTVKKGSSEKPATGAYFFISDCTKSTVFAATAVGADGDSWVISHGSSAGSPNAKDNIGSYTTGAVVAPVDTVVYYIAQSEDAPQGQVMPSLWRIVTSEPAGDPKIPPGTPQEIVPGVEAMQIEYGVDTNGDRLVDEYRKAKDVGADDWRNVIVVKLALLVRSVEETGVEPDGKTYTLLDDTKLGPFNDRRQRTILTTTVTLRNVAS